MRVQINLAADDQSQWRGGPVEWGEPCSLEDAGEVVLHLGPVEVRMSYGQFETLIDNIQRQRWLLPPETGIIDLTADNPPPSWDAYVQAVAGEVASERHTIAVDLEQEADIHGLLPAPPDRDKLALRHFLAGRTAGERDGLLRAAGMVRARAARFDPPGAAAPEKKSDRSKRKQPV